jgi:hypothetical protein
MTYGADFVAPTQHLREQIVHASPAKEATS